MREKSGLARTDPLSLVSYGCGTNYSMYQK